MIRHGSIVVEELPMSTLVALLLKVCMCHQMPIL